MDWISRHKISKEGGAGKAGWTRKAQSAARTRTHARTHAGAGGAVLKKKKD